MSPNASKQEPHGPRVELPPWMSLSVDEAAQCTRLIRVLRSEYGILRYIVRMLLEMDAVEAEHLTIERVIDRLGEFRDFEKAAVEFATKALRRSYFRSHPFARAAFEMSDQFAQEPGGDYGLDRLLANTRRAEELAAKAKAEKKAAEPRRRRARSTAQERA